MTETPKRMGSLFLAALIASTAMGPMAMQLLVPSLPAVASDFQVPPAISQLNISLAMVVIGISTLFYGPLSDRFGRRPMMTFGILIFVIGTAICAIAPTIGLLIFGRAIQAIGGAAGMVVARAMVRDVYGPEKSLPMISMLTVAVIAAPMIAVVLGGVLTDNLGWRWVFYFALAVSLPVALLTITSLRETRPGQRHAGSVVVETARGYRAVFRSKVFAGYALQGGFSPGTFFAFMGAGPYVMIEMLGRPATEFGIYFAIVTAVFMAANLIGGKLATRFGTARMVLIGGFWSFASATAGLVWFLVGELNVWMIFITIGVASIGNGMAMPSTQVGGMNEVPEYSGTASGALASIQTMLGALFAQVAGSLVTDSALPMFVVMVVATGFAAFFATWPTIFRNRG